MVLWRISRHRDLDGLGGLRAPGRWHERGFPVVYLAETPAGALLEVCVHTSANDIPPNYTLLEITVPTGISVETLDVNTLLPDWLKDLEETRAVGTEWLRSTRSALLRVPSVIVPATFNVLLNPGHPESKTIGISRMIEYPFDIRLKL
jgi:RES domain-containing protein